MFFLLVVLSLAQTPECDAAANDCPDEIEILETEDLDQAILYLIKEDKKRRKEKSSIPLCPFEPRRHWNVECA